MPETARAAPEPLSEAAFRTKAVEFAEAISCRNADLLKIAQQASVMCHVSMKPIEGVMLGVGIQCDYELLSDNERQGIYGWISLPQWPLGRNRWLQCCTGYHSYVGNHPHKR